MSTAFDAALTQLIGLEGKYTNDPNDPGGETKWGISKRSYPDVDIANLSRDDAAAIYERDFWNKLRCSELPDAVGRMCFQSAVNVGAWVAARCLQRALGLTADGVIGAQTISAAQHYPDPVELLALVGTETVFGYLLDQNFDRYGRGWIKRAFIEAIDAEL
jgi:lysozyme family protein